MRTWLGASEAVTTLLLNFIANDIMLYLIYQSWKDPNGSGQPQSRPLAHSAQLPKLFGSQLNLGLLIALAAAVGDLVRCCSAPAGASPCGWSAATARRPADRACR